MSWNQNLVGKALSIAQTDCKFLRVMAGPGTGKTYAMKRRVARLLEEGGDPRRLLVVTFTRVAAAALVRELADLEVEGCEKIKSGTLHSFCFRTLMRQEAFDFLGRVPRPLITFLTFGVLRFEAAPLLEDIRADGNRKDTKRIRAFEAAWARLQSDQPGWPQDPADRQFHDALISWLTFHNAMLIGELVPEVLKYLRNNPTSPELCAFDHVIVDEYQDLNRADQVLLDLLSAQGNSVVIGDEDQSIYRSLRYAHPEGIKEFSTHHVPTHDEDLDECRRCPTRVVELANSLITHNHPASATPRRRPKAGNSVGDVHILQWVSMDEEAAGVAQFIKWSVDNRHYEPGDILVLSPRRLLAYRVRDLLNQLSIPVHSFYHEEALEEDAAQEAFSYLSLMAYAEDRVALRFLLGCRSTNWLAAQYGKLRSFCEQNNHSPREALDQVLAGTIKIPKIRNLTERYKKIVQRLDSLRSLQCEGVIDELFPADLSDTQLLRDSALGLLQEDMTPDKLFHRLRDAITQPEVPESEDFVRIMSLQKSKGLTSKAVIVLGCVEGLLPVTDPNLSMAERTDLLQEQRRLFYVAVTRPTDMLLLSSFRTIQSALAFKIGANPVMGYGNVRRTVASQFLTELGPTAPAAKIGSEWAANSYQV